MSHTPGPWKVSGLDPSVVGPVRILILDTAPVPQQQAVARIIERTDQSIANAHLIAAAPELLDAAKAFAENAIETADGNIVFGYRALDLLRAAIAKAEGR